MYDLTPILDYKMDDLQGKAYKVGLLWIDLSQKIFPNYKHRARYPKRSDPRKSSLFKFAYKMVRETQGILPDADIKLYITAQLQILASITINQAHPLIEPMCMVGDKAWIRWKIWKRKFDHIRQTDVDVGLDKTTLEKIKTDLENTKKFFQGKFNKVTEEKIMMACRDLVRWVSLGKVSPFYALLSPWVKKHCAMNNINIDLSLYQESITQETQEIFKKIFEYEF